MLQLVLRFVKNVYIITYVLKQWLLWKIINIQNCTSWCKWFCNKAYQAFSIDVLSKKVIKSPVQNLAVSDE